MVPTQFMSTTVTMLTHAVPQLLNFTDQFFTRHLIKVFVHASSELFLSTPAR